MGHSWSYSLCDRHSICPLWLIVTPNFLYKLPNLGTEVYWQMACFLWLPVFVDTSHRHTSHNFPDSTELTSINQRYIIHILFISTDLLPIHPTSHYTNSYTTFPIYEFVYKYINLAMNYEIVSKEICHLAELLQMKKGHKIKHGNDVTCIVCLSVGRNAFFLKLNSPIERRLLFPSRIAVQSLALGEERHMNWANIQNV